MKNPIERILDFGDFQLNSERLGRVAEFFLLDRLNNENSPWYEAPEQIEAALRWGKEKERRLNWVRSMMSLYLTSVERKSVTLHYLRDLSFREASKIMGVSPSTVHRALRRGVDKLREQAAKSTRYGGKIRPRQKQGRGRKRRRNACARGARR